MSQAGRGADSFSLPSQPIARHLRVIPSAAMNTWAFNQLNQITPETSPHNGPGSEQDRNDSSLSFPVSGAALQQQLEAWTNVAFDFDSSDFGSSLDGSFEAKAGGGGETDRMTGREYYGRVSAGLDNYSLGIGHDDSFQSLLGVDPLLAAAPVDHFANLFATSTVNNSLLLGPPAAAADLPVAPTTSPADSYKAPKGAAKKRRASSSVGSSVPPETPAESAGPIDADDELNAVAVEEDKRRRNTAASGQSHPLPILSPSSLTPLANFFLFLSAVPLSPVPRLAPGPSSIPD